MWKLTPQQRHVLLALQASFSIAEINVKHLLTQLKPIVLAGLKVLNGLAIDGSKVSVRPTCTSDLNSKTTIFIRNLNDQTSINDLLPLLSQFGIVLSAYMPVDPILKKSKGIAYVDYDTPEAARSAIEQVSVKIIENLWTN